MMQMDTPVLDVIYGEDAKLTPELMIDALGGQAAAETRAILDVDIDAPQYEAEFSPTIIVRRRGERRLLFIDEQAQPMRKNPRSEPIVAKDLRAEKKRLVELVEKTGARLGRLQAFGSWGDACIVVRSARDLRALMLLGWALDPVTDVDGRRRASPLGQREFEEKLAAYARRLEELDDAAILARVPPAALEKRGEILVIDVLSDRDGSWDVRKSFELEKRVAATDLFARIPGARVPAPVIVAESAAPTSEKRPDLDDTRPLKAPGGPAPSGAGATPSPSVSTAAAPPRDSAPTGAATHTTQSPGTAAASAASAPPPAGEPPRPAGPPLEVIELGPRLVLKIPAERFDTDTIMRMAKKSLDVLGASDRVSGAHKDRMHHDGYGFVAPLSFLSEVFVDGRPLDKKRLEQDGRPGPGGVRLLEVLLPRFGTVLLLDFGPGRRFVTSEVDASPDAVLAAVRG
jgi:hypothetical protein